MEINGKRLTVHYSPENIRYIGKSIYSIGIEDNKGLSIIDTSSMLEMFTIIEDTLKTWKASL